LLPFSVFLQNKRRVHNKQKNDHQEFDEFNRMLNHTLVHLFPVDLKPETDRCVSYIRHILKHKGSEYTVRYLKATGESVEQILYQLDGRLEHTGISLGKDSNGWPTWLGNRLKSNCLQGETASIRLVLTLVSTRCLITIPTKTNLGSITNASTIDPLPAITRCLDSVGGAVANYSKRIRHLEIGSEAVNKVTDVITTYQTPRMMVSSKSTPNGVGYTSFPWDRASIIKSDLQDNLIAFAESYYQGDADEWVEDKLEPYEELVDSNRQLHTGKISLTHEAGKLKPRVFAIVDSLTQSLLSDFHDDLMLILKSIPEDCTFDHNKVVETAKLKATQAKPFYGFADMSSATDRIPKQLYEEIGNIWRSGLGTAWVGLFDRDFTVSKSVKDHWHQEDEFKSHVRYKVGQPMGALSSWPFMAFCHHVLVWYCFGSKQAAKGNYHVLGDDVVIFNKDAYQRYLKMLDDLEVSYTNNFSAIGFEFAKRFFYKGKEITGAYTSALWATRNTPELFTFEWKNLSSRGYSTRIALPPNFKVYLKVNSKRFEKLEFLFSVPSGTEIQLEELAQFCVGLSGRSTCLLRGESKDRLVEAVVAFRQAAAFLIRQEFQNSLDTAKAAVLDNAKNFGVAFIELSGLDERYTSVIQTAINEYRSDRNTRIRYLERDLKNLYLSPTDKSLLRPNLPDLPRRIDFSRKDKMVERLKFRATHQLNIRALLRG